jgi:hypothetical protein
LNSVKSLSSYKPLEQHEALITHILEGLTVSINESIYLRNLESPEQTVMRNLIFKNFGEKAQWKKADLKKAINAFITEREIITDDESLNKLIS